MLELSAKQHECQVRMRLSSTPECMQTPDVFDVFCFTMCWQALREAFATPTSATSSGDGDGTEASTSRQAAPAWNWQKRQAAVDAACAVTTRDHLEGRPEAIQAAFNHSAAIMRLTLSHKDSKSPVAHRVLPLPSNGPVHAESPCQ